MNIENDTQASVLDSKIFRVLTEGEEVYVTLPGLMALASADLIEDIPTLRAHQRHTVHMALAQLAALAEVIDDHDEQSWREALLKIDADPKAWQVFPEMGDYGFFQPAFPKGSKIKSIENSVSSIDVLTLASRHGVKPEQPDSAELDEWIWHLITVQTGGNYPGPKNFGSYRMNGGYASRSMIAIYDQSWGFGRRIMEDAKLILSLHDKVTKDFGFAAKNGIKLSWKAPWPEGYKDASKKIGPVAGMFLHAHELDARNLEISRRYNLQLLPDGTIRAIKGTSLAPRTALAKSDDVKNFMAGYCGDIWASTITAMNKKSGALQQKCFNMPKDGLTYENIVTHSMGVSFNELTVHPPPATQRKVANPVLVMAGIAMGQKGTSGLHMKEIPFETQRSAGGLYAIPTLGETAAMMVRDARHVEFALSSAIKSYMDLVKLPDTIWDAQSAAFSRHVGDIFFDVLIPLSDDEPDAHRNWIAALWDLAKLRLDQAYEEIAVPRTARLKRIAAADNKLLRSFWSEHNAGVFQWKEDILSQKKEKLCA